MFWSDERATGVERPCEVAWQFSFCEGARVVLTNLLIPCRTPGRQLTIDAGKGRTPGTRVPGQLNSRLAITGSANLAPVIRLRLGMNQHPEELGNLLAELAFQGGLYIVNPGERQVVLHRAMQ